MVATKYDFTAEEVAIMRRQYELHVPMTLIAEQWGLEGGGLYDVIFRLFRKHDSDFKPHLKRKAETKKWCPWCGKDMPAFSKRKYCDDKTCKAERSPPSTHSYCACGNKKAWRNGSTCKACAIKRAKAKKANRLYTIRRMALEGYSNKQIAKRIGLSLTRTRLYRSELGLPYRKHGWRSEQEAYWKAKVVEAGSAMAVWEKSGLTYAAFLSRLYRSGFISSKEARAG